MIHDLYLRAHIVVSGEESEQKEQSTKRSRSAKPWPDYALVWDTETTLDLEQTLNFGVWRFCQLQGTEYVAVQEGIFYADGQVRKDIQTILTYSEKHLADGLVNGSGSELAVLSRAEFIERIFWESVRAGAVVAGFNLPFDLSRVAVHWAAARNGGFSFVLSQLSKKQVENIHRPRVRIAPLNGVAEQVELTAVRRKNEQHKWRRGRFLDLHTLAFALTDSSYSLAGAIDEFGSEPQKMEHEPTGRVTETEITYARQDVRASLGLLNALKHEYELHPIALPPDKAYSPASIGKAYLRAMGIVEPMRKFKDLASKIHGITMAGYFGGRAECHIRRWPVPVVPVDLTSEYPSVDALLGIWNVLTAKRLTIDDATEDVRTLLANFTLDDLFRPAFWKQLNFYARIEPKGDILPVRSVYGNKSGTCNIGLNELHWKQPMWAAGPDLVASVLLSDGHVPSVQEAFRIVPHGKQPGLRPIKLRGAISIDPRKEDFFTRVIEYRMQNKSDDRLQYFLKILANSASYGTYLELNPVKVDPSSRPKITVYSGERIFEQPAPDTIEQPGSFYFPLLGALITSGGRLLLAMIERCVRDAGGTYLCCDTDALIIVASQSGGLVQMPDGAAPIKAFSWSEVDGITKRFDSLSPYNRDIVPHLLRLTDENCGKNGQRQLFGLSIAAKRYALYTTRCGQPYCRHRNCVTIVDPKAHGLIFFAPSEKRENGLPKWWWELWRFLLALEFKQIIDPDFNVLMVAGRAIDATTGSDIDGQPSWIGLPAMMKMRISTPHYLDQMKGKASPFGFVLHPRIRDKLRLTLLTPFSKNRAGWANSPCINTHDGKSYRLDDFSRADIVTLGDILCGYIQHREIKSLGADGEKCKAHTRGLLQRMTINGGLQHCIGKEVSRFEQGKDDFIENIDDICIHYDGGRVTANETLKEEIRALGLRKTTKQTGLDRKTIREILNGQKVKASTLAKVAIGLQRE